MSITHAPLVCHMNKYFLLAAALICCSNLYTQSPPLNDDCIGIVDLGTAPACPSTVFSNLQATPSDIGSDNLPSCFVGDTARRDVWFQFTCPQGLVDFRLTIEGTGATPLTNPQVAVYRGDCEVDGLAELLCAAAAAGLRNLALDLTSLTPNAVYFLRISDYAVGSTPNWGDFILCIDSIPPIVTIDGGGSSLCQGTIYDSGGPNAPYGPNEDFTFVICPAQSPACIQFTLDYFNIESDAFGVADQLTLFDGPSVNSPVLASIGGDFFIDDNAVSAGGGVCFQVSATSGCLTLQFQSNASVELEGFQGSWSCSPVSCPEPDLPFINSSSATADSIVAAVSTPATQVSVAKVQCPQGAYGTFRFEGDPGPLGLQKGLLLTTGQAALAIGPNDNQLASINNGTPGDSDLDVLSTQSGNFLPSFDACVVELDVFVSSDELVFEYAFGSEEYPEFVGEGFNDIFAFLVSGPGISGNPSIGNAQNVAVLPGTNIPIEIETVNNLVNWTYYRNTENSPFIRYDGMTIDNLGVKKTLTARIPVVPCNLYRLKLAIADRGDAVYDSGVFLSEISGGGPKLVVAFASGIDYLVENCSGNLDRILVSLQEPSPADQQYIVTVSGSATRDQDYTLDMPDTITIPAGTLQLSFPIIPLDDALLEGTEIITITLSKDFGCGMVQLSSVDIPLNDDLDVEINAGADTLYTCAGGVLQLEASGATSYFWQPPGAVSNPQIPNPTISTTQDIELRVTGTLGNCSNTDTVYIRVLDPTVEVQALGATDICLGQSVTLKALTNTGGQGLKWTPFNGLSDPGSTITSASPSATTTYRATLSIPGCTVFDEITIRVDTLFRPTLTGDTTVCQHYPVKLGADLPSNSSTYVWSPGAFLSDSTAPSPLALPPTTTTYTLIASSANLYCADTTEVTITVTPADIRIQAPDSIDICLGTAVQLGTTLNPTGGIVQWSPPFFTTPTTGPSVSTTPDESITLFAQYTVNGCVVTDSVYIRVDSLPAESSIARVQDKPIYCPGDTIILVSKTYEPASFPDIKHQWEPFAGMETSLELWNMVLTATETNVFRRITQNRACSTVDTVEVPVGVIPEITITADPPAFCPGGSTRLRATVVPDQKLEWDENPALSCTECPDPTAAPAFTNQFTVSTPDADCPASSSILVTVLPLPELQLPENPEICPGADVRLNDIEEPGVTYTWSSNPPGFDTNDPTPLATPATTTTYFVLAQGACTTRDTVLVTVLQGSVQAGADQTVCFGEGAVLTALTGGAAGFVTWLPGNLVGNSVTVSPGLTTDYTAIYTFGSANCTVLDMVRVNVLPAIAISAITAVPDTTELCEGAPLKLSVAADPPNLSISWTQDGAGISGANDTLLTVTPPGGKDEPIAYIFVATATDQNGCTVSSPPYTARVRRCLYIPNVFTPGNDNINETFGVVVPGGQANVRSMEIYNRWGQKIFQTQASNERWDGTSGGKPAPADVYVYVIRVQFADGREEVIHGDVTLLR